MDERRAKQIYLIVPCTAGWAVGYGADVLVTFATKSEAQAHAQMLVETSHSHGEAAEIADPYGAELTHASEPVLLVDDDPIVTLVTRDALEERGFEVVSANCAADAVRIMAEPRSWSGLVTDIDLGPGEDGFAVARAARARHPGLAVVFISGHEQGRYSVHGVQPSQLIAKPFDPRRVADAIEESR
jgi:CheY-like chemotaxis protein